MAIYDHQITQDRIRERSYLLWESEGRQDGRSEEYWARAQAALEQELERSWLVALEERENLDLAMPKAPISQTPYRHEAGKIDPDWFREAA